MEDAQCPDHDILRGQGPSALHREEEMGVMLTDFHAGARQAHLSTVASALGTKGTLVHIFDLYCLLELIEFVDFARALLNEFSLLLQRQARVEQF